MTRTKLAATVLALATVFAAPAASAFYAAVPKAIVIDQTSGGAGSWTYGYSVLNSSYCAFGNCSGTVLGEPVDALLAIGKFSVPYFDDGSISNIVSPTGWSYAVSTTDTFELGAGAGTLTWSSSDPAHVIAIGGALGGFSYNSIYAPGKGPFEAVLRNGASVIGDPAVPLSPHAVAAGLLPIGTVSPVPEPQSWMLLLAGAGMVAAMRAVRRAK